MSGQGRVVVLMGGPSNERAISLLSGNAVLEALIRAGIDAIGFDPAERSLFELASMNVARVFIALHGRFGEDGTVQGALEVMGIPYTGSGVMASAIALDKYRTKLIWQSVGIPTAPFVMMDSSASAAEILHRLGGAVFVKPVHEGSSLGMSKATTVEALQTAYDLAKTYDSRVLVESYVSGKELTVAILGDRALPIVHIDAPRGKYDYQNKYFTDEVTYNCPAQIPAAQTTAIQRDAVAAFSAIGCHGWARADVMLQPDGRYFFLEINTAPGMTGHSLVPIAARAEGIAFDQLCIRILDGASCTPRSAHVG
jgi:D-alanine-D-alanine ligase